MKLALLVSRAIVKYVISGVPPRKDFRPTLAVQKVIAGNISPVEPRSTELEVVLMSKRKKFVNVFDDSHKPNDKEEKTHKKYLNEKKMVCVPCKPLGLKDLGISLDNEQI